MNNTASILKFFQKKEQLTFANERYKSLVHDLFVWLFKNDRVDDDLTTKSLFSKTNESSNAYILTRGDITVAGLEEIEYLIKTFTKLTITLLRKDGDHLQKGEKF